MRAADTNVLIRFVTRDDEDQFQTASRFFSECSEKKPGFITSTVLVEFVWTLKATYRYSREQISSKLNDLINSREVVVEHSDEAQRANELYRDGEAEGFADAYAGLVALKYGCSDTVTFDRKAARLEFYQELAG